MCQKRRLLRRAAHSQQPDRWLQGQRQPSQRSAAGTHPTSAFGFAPCTAELAKMRSNGFWECALSSHKNFLPVRARLRMFLLTHALHFAGCLLLPSEVSMPRVGFHQCSPTASLPKISAKGKSGKASMLTRTSRKQIVELHRRGA